MATANRLVPSCATARRSAPERRDPTPGGAPATPPPCLPPSDDPDRLGRMLHQLEPRLIAVARRFTGDGDAARDVVQSAFEKVVRHGHQFRGRSRVSTWIHRIVANEALMWLRTERRRRQRTVELDESRRATLSDPSPGPPEVLALRQRTLAVRAGLAALPREEREVLTRCAIEGRSYAELARETGVHPGALKSRAFRARRRLSLVLQDA